MYDWPNRIRVITQLQTFVAHLVLLVIANHLVIESEVDRCFRGVRVEHVAQVFQEDVAMKGAKYFKRD